MFIKLQLCYWNSHKLGWTGKPVNVFHLETHQREVVDNCCLPVQLYCRLQGFGLFLTIWDILNYRGKRSSFKIYRLPKLQKCVQVHYSHAFPFPVCINVCLHCVPGNHFSPRSAVRCCLPKQFQTAAIPLNQPARETFPHSLSKCRLLPSLLPSFPLH